MITESTFQRRAFWGVLAAKTWTGAQLTEFDLTVRLAALQIATPDPMDKAALAAARHAVEFMLASRMEADRREAARRELVNG